MACSMRGYICGSYDPISQKLCLVYGVPFRGFTGVEGWALRVLPFIFAGMVILLDRGILTMDSPSGGKRLRVVVARVSMLVVLALITAVPVEMRVFGPEIDRAIAAAEKVKIDQIREGAKVYEQGLHEKRLASSEAALSGNPEDVVTRRKAEREAVVAQQTIDRKEITDRLSAKSREVRDEVRRGRYSGRGGGYGDGTRLLREQEADIRAELRQFDADARQQLSDFDTETERMRTAAVQTGTDERARLATELDEKLHDIEVMEPETLAAAYGGDFKEPNGFLARYRILLATVEAPDQVMYLWGMVSRNEIIVWGCRLVMITFGLAVLFIKFVMTSPETTAYFSLRAQAVEGNEEARRIVRMLALTGNRDAILTLRMLAREDGEARTVLSKLGFDGHVESALLSDHVIDLHRRLSEARSDCARSLAAFRDSFRELCRTRTPPIGSGMVPMALSRDMLVERSLALWREGVQPKIERVSQIEAWLAHEGVAVPRWSPDLEEADPRTTRQRLWLLPDVELEEQFGWDSPTNAPFRHPGTPVA